MAIEKFFFRQVMGRFATGVTVVTTHDHGTPAGLTVNAFASLSLNPPLVLICVDLTSRVLPIIRESGIFAVNILTEEQEHLSSCFATPSADRYEHFCYAEYQTVATGAPILKDTLAFIDTRVVAEYPGGDHVIFIGQVEAMGTAGEIVFADDTAPTHSAISNSLATITDPEALPLGYYRGQYRHLAPNYTKPSLSTPVPAENQNHQHPSPTDIYSKETV
jgi:flavin reductase (DIM6/NTAB) family NADH-FMN oxidoreductase RutF